MDCPHPDALVAGRACQHLIGDPEPTFCVQFPGVGRAYELLCTDCARRGRDSDSLGFLCEDCFAAVEAGGIWDTSERGIIGRPEISERPTELHFVHDMIRLPGSLPASILDLQPVARSMHPQFVALLSDGSLYALDLFSRAMTRLCQTGEVPPPDGALELSRCGSYAAVYSRFGRHGRWIDLPQRRIVESFDRGPIIPDETEFPLLFLEYGQRTLLVRATEPHRLDAFDPRTGALLTAREQPPRRLEYIHGRLLGSPQGAWLADSGWMPGPCGFVSAFSTVRWFNENNWESEEGTTRKSFGQRWRAWDADMCWVGPTTLAVWGHGPDAACVLPAVTLYELSRGHRLTWFPGPVGWLAFDQFLFSCDARGGTSVWDVASGDRLLCDPGFHPQRYHPGARCFLSTRPDGEFFVVSRLVSGAR